MKKITVKSEPNGYSLSVDGAKGDWFYFSEDDLVKGMIYHIGIKKYSQAKKNFLDNLITAMDTWPNASDAAISAAVSKKELERVTDLCKAKDETIANIRKHNAGLSTALEQMKLRVAKLEVQISRMTAKDKKTSHPYAKQKAPLSVLTPGQITEDTYKELMVRLTMESTKMGRRTLGVLKYAGGKVNNTLADIARLSYTQLSHTRGAGRKVLAEIEVYFNEHGLQFGMDVDAIINKYKSSNL